MSSQFLERPNLPPAAALNARQEAFCESYDELPNAAAAARHAGYSEHSARSQGSKLLADGNIQQHIATLKKIRARARALDRELLLERLETLYHAAMGEGRLNAAIQALRLMAQIGGYISRGGQSDMADTDPEALEEAEILGPLQRAARRGDRQGVDPEDRQAASGEASEAAAVEALIAGARRRLAETRPDPLPAGASLRARLFMGTASIRRSVAGSGTASGPLSGTVSGEAGGKAQSLLK